MIRLFGLASIAALVACSTSSSSTKPGLTNVHNKTQKPPNATSMGKVKKVAPPNLPGAPSISTQQPGDDGDEAFVWQQDIDDDGTLDDCMEALDDETGDVLLACAPYKDTCEDGSELSGAIFVLQHADGSGVEGFAAADVCGAGSGLFGCQFDASGEELGCGVCTIPTDGTDFTCTAE